jgi:hypothetical protein
VTIFGVDWARGKPVTVMVISGRKTGKTQLMKAMLRRERRRIARLNSGPGRRNARPIKVAHVGSPR